MTTTGEQLEALAGEPLLEAVTDAIVSLHLRHHGGTPGAAGTDLLDDDLLACKLGGIHPGIGRQRARDVRATRREFQAATRHEFIGAVERLSGRSVVAFISTYHVGHDVAVELFLLEPER